MISSRLGFNHVTHTLEVIKDKVVSKCECFINEDAIACSTNSPELMMVPAYSSLLINI